mmetsp:Transcript_57535/g.136866  ORF Transcript_57535/g.136866 Transcript_57535/m.136866 type:complete len:100 (+) Transcript_57535:495-794(+)
MSKSTSFSLRVSSSSDLTKDMCTPRDRCMPAHAMQITVPWVKEAQGCEEQSPSQSKQRSLPGRRIITSVDGGTSSMSLNHLGFYSHCVATGPGSVFLVS